MDWKNKLYFGDNLLSVAAIYDRRFFIVEKSRRSQTAATAHCEESAAQITAFEDTWQWGLESEAVYKEIVTSGPRKLADLMQALLAFLGRSLPQNATRPINTGIMPQEARTTPT